MQMGIRKERAIAVIDIIMSALCIRVCVCVCTVVVALFDLLAGIFSPVLFSSSPSPLSLAFYRRKRRKFDCIQSPFSL